MLPMCPFLPSAPTLPGAPHFSPGQLPCSLAALPTSTGTPPPPCHVPPKKNQPCSGVEASVGVLLLSLSAVFRSQPTRDRVQEASSGLPGKNQFPWGIPSWHHGPPRHCESKTSIFMDQCPSPLSEPSPPEGGTGCAPNSRQDAITLWWINEWTTPTLTRAGSRLAAEHRTPDCGAVKALPSLADGPAGASRPTEDP